MEVLAKLTTTERRRNDGQATQDFSSRIVIVVNKELGSWQISNAVAHISAYLGHQLGANFDTGAFFYHLGWGGASPKYPLSDCGVGSKTRPNE